MTLDRARRGSEVRIISISDPKCRSLLMRMGVSEGSRVVCREKLWLGPVIVQCKRQEIALGHKLARRIHVE